jgi:lysophospholipid acyltransferase (LPLAT)-like uncharacterized protein
LHSSSMRNAAELLRTTSNTETKNSGKWSLLDRLKIAIISSMGYWIIRIICGSLRWEKIDWSNLESIHHEGRRFIVAFWHNRIFLGTYAFRNRGIVVMTSQNRDGEYIARVIQRFGYGAARGSSTRGSRGAIVEMLQCLKENRDVAFTMDGPLGPRYVAKPGAAYVARKSGNAVLPFSVSVEKQWVIGSWDRFIIPKPFSRAFLLLGTPIYINKGATAEEIKRVEAKIQSSLEDLQERTDTHWGGKDRR